MSNLTTTDNSGNLEPTNPIKYPKGKHPNSLKQLEIGKFKPNNGKGGRPKGSVNITDSLRRNLQRIAEGKDPIDKRAKAMPMRDWVGVALIAKAASGDVNAIKELLNRVEGSVVNKTEVTGKNGSAVEIEYDQRLSLVLERATEAFAIGSNIPLPPPTKE